MNKKNENLIIKDIDIATVEVLHDVLLDSKKITKNDIIHKRYLVTVKKMYALKYMQEQQSKQLASKTILEEANDIIFKRQEEKQREYGPIDESLEDASIVASMISNEAINTKMVYAVLIGLKISRLRWNKKHDTFLDGIGYMAAFENYLKKQNNKDE